MTGYRNSTRPVVDTCLRFDAAGLGLRVGDAESGPCHWVETINKAVIAAVWCEVNLLDPAAGYLDLSHTMTGAYGVEGQTARIRCVTTPMHLGGQRTWFVCPVSGKRVRCLYCPPGQHTFASRAVHHLSYRSERETTDDRLLRAARKAHFRLGGDGNLFCRPTKPKWMRWKTYRRLRDSLAQASTRSFISAAEQIGFPLPSGAS